MARVSKDEEIRRSRDHSQAFGDDSPSSRPFGPPQDEVQSKPRTIWRDSCLSDLRRAAGGRLPPPKARFWPFGRAWRSAPGCSAVEMLALAARMFGALRAPRALASARRVDAARRLRVVMALIGAAAVGDGKRLARQLLDLPQQRPLAVVAQRNRAARAPARAVRPMRWT